MSALPDPYITVPNPAFEKCVERAAIERCDEHGPSPCIACLQAARRELLREVAR
jgi:hypothetical protein